MQPTILFSDLPESIQKLITDTAHSDRLNLQFGTTSLHIMHGRAVYNGKHVVYSPEQMVLGDQTIKMEDLPTWASSTIKMNGLGNGTTQISWEGATLLIENGAATFNGQRVIE